MPVDQLVTHVTLDGRRVPVLGRRNPRAKRLIMRLDPDGGAVRVTLPPGAPWEAARQMVEDKAGWIMGRWRHRVEPISFADGAAVPLRGDPHVIRHHPQARAGVRAVAGEIVVSGGAEHLPRRVRDWLKREARNDITALVALHAGALGLRPGRITLRDTRSRWGSCAANGNLSFSWRLILAPGEICDYVVAHEVAHLAEMNHGPRFWALVAQRVPQWRQHRDWLNRQGRTLFLYG